MKAENTAIVECRRAEKNVSYSLSFDKNLFISITKETPIKYFFNDMGKNYRNFPDKNTALFLAISTVVTNFKKFFKL